MRHVSPTQSSLLYYMFVSLLAMIYFIRVSCIKCTAITQTNSVAYPELVSGGGGSKSHKCKGLEKVGASKVSLVDIKKIMAGEGFRATRKPPWIRHRSCFKDGLCSF